MNISGNSLVHGSHRSNALKLIWSWLCTRLCTAHQHQLPGGFAHPSWSQGVPLEFLGYFHTVFRAPVEKLSWVWVSLVIRRARELVQADQIQPFSWPKQRAPALGNARALGVNVLLGSVLFPAHFLLILFLRSYLLAPQLPTFLISPPQCPSSLHSFSPSFP